LNRESGVVTKEGKVVSLTTLSGKTFEGKMFIDATYEGDLMAAAGVSYMVGREPCSQYNEEWNGVQAGVYHHGHYFKSDISPYVVPNDPTADSCLIFPVNPYNPIVRVIKRSRLTVSGYV